MSVFGALQTFLHLNLWVSAVIAVAATLITWLERAVALYDKSLDVRKKSIELKKLAREEKEREQLVRLATPDEVHEHGKGYVERELRARERSKTEEVIKPKPFVSESREHRL